MLPVDRGRLLRAEYRTRINRVLDYIDKNIGQTLRLDDLARVANFSPYHFHRIFSALVGETINSWVQRRRAEMAASALLHSPTASITAIALDFGYSGPDAFARSFRERFGMSASEWRAGGSETWRKMRQAKRNPGQAIGKDGQDSAAASSYDGDDSNPQRRSFMDKSKFNVEVKELPGLEVAYVRHHGPFPGVAGAFETLMRWAGPRRLLRFPETKMLAVYHDNPDITETDKLRSDACITVPPETKAEGEIGRMAIPGGLFAVAHAEIDRTEFGQAWDAVMRDWLPESGFQPDDRMCYEVYLNDPKDHPEGKFVIEICEPIRPL